MTEPSQGWKGLIANVRSQGRRFDPAIAETGDYYAFLSKADPLGSSLSDAVTWDVLFELVPKVWLDNALMSAKTAVRAPLPSPPATFYHVHDVEESELLSALGLTGTDMLAEGSWYTLTLNPGKAGPIVGDLYDWDFYGPVPESE